jgi:hypothetical protein
MSSGPIVGACTENLGSCFLNSSTSPLGGGKWREVTPRQHSILSYLNRPLQFMALAPSTSGLVEHLWGWDLTTRHQFFFSRGWYVLGWNYFGRVHFLIEAVSTLTGWFHTMSLLLLFRGLPTTTVAVSVVVYFHDSSIILLVLLLCHYMPYLYNCHYILSLLRLYCDSYYWWVAHINCVFAYSCFYMWKGGRGRDSRADAAWGYLRYRHHHPRRCCCAFLWAANFSPHWLLVEVEVLFYTYVLHRVEYPWHQTSLPSSWAVSDLWYCACTLRYVPLSSLWMLSHSMSLHLTLCLSVCEYLLC